LPITQFLGSPKFDPETKRSVGVAFEMARAALSLTTRLPPSSIGATTSLPPGWVSRWSKTMAREDLKWQNIDADDLPAEVKRSFDAMVETEAVFKADLEC
jgi:hypothetical protein